MKRSTRRPHPLVALLAAALAIAALPTEGWADRPHGRRHDIRHHHDRHYRPHGHVIRHLPHRHHRVFAHRSPYYYHLGVFYRPHATGFVVAPAPIGVIVLVLPPGYVTLYMGGHPYYYGNFTYYAWDRPAGGYRVIEEPAGVEAATAIPSELFVYPRKGQSEEQQATDRYECHAWAVKETGADPSLGEPLAEAARAEYQRATTACLEARGYTVR